MSISINVHVINYTPNLWIISTHDCEFWKSYSEIFLLKGLTCCWSSSFIFGNSLLHRTWVHKECLLAVDRSCSGRIPIDAFGNTSPLRGPVSTSPLWSFLNEAQNRSPRGSSRTFSSRTLLLDSAVTLPYRLGGTQLGLWHLRCTGPVDQRSWNERDKVREKVQRSNQARVISCFYFVFGSLQP